MAVGGNHAHTLPILPLMWPFASSCNTWRQHSSFFLCVLALILGKNLSSSVVVCTNESTFAPGVVETFVHMAVFTFSWCCHLRSDPDRARRLWVSYHHACTLLLVQAWEQTHLTALCAASNGKPQRFLLVMHGVSFLAWCLALLAFCWKAASCHWASL